ncbi:uncharacterized protein At4g19900-like [Typha angustifolia]|uniref:uncharacterized protein At4g19900-like n=1 Tax=Typha angustifolia TaxID=59011 RepID=UPI003C2E1D36
MSKARRPLSLLITIPSSIVAFSFFFLFLACNGFGLCIAGDAICRPLRDPLPKTSSLLSLQEETQLSSPKSNQSSHLAQDSSDGYLLPNSSALPRGVAKWWRRSNVLPRLLRPNSPSRRFSTRASEFLNWSSPSNSPCTIQFFMTWFSPLEDFGPRELFVMESLFKSHQNACLLIVSSTLDSPKGTQLLKPFKDRGFKVAALAPDFAYLLKNTPAQAWFARLRRGEVNPGDVSLGQNLSNLIRLVLLYKYGGVYIDADVIIMRSFHGLRNAIGAQTAVAATGNWSRLNNAVMVFDEKHPLLREFIEEFATTFDGNKWGHNGPYLVSRVVERVESRQGFEFSILPPVAFYPVDWSRIGGLFQGPKGGKHSQWVSMKLNWIRKQSFAVHLWNRRSRRIKVEEGSIIGRIISDCCVFCNFSLHTV